MSLGRLRRGELVVLLGLAGLLVSAFLRWFDFDRVKDPDAGASVFGTTDAGWGYLGTPWIVLLVVVAVTAVVVAATAARAGAGRPSYGAVVALVVGIPVAALAFVLLSVRVLLATPTPALADLGGGSIVSTLSTTDVRPDLSVLEAELSVAVGAWVGLASVLAILVGLWIALSDDRASAAESLASSRPDVSGVPPLRREPPSAEPAAPAAPWTPSPESPVPPDVDDASRPAGGGLG